MVGFFVQGMCFAVIPYNSNLTIESCYSVLLKIDTTEHISDFITTTRVLRRLRQKYRTFYCDNEHWMYCTSIQIKKQKKKRGMI